jgi:hypothetical protein
MEGSEFCLIKEISHRSREYCGRRVILVAVMFLRRRLDEKPKSNVLQIRLDRWLVDAAQIIS